MACPFFCACEGKESKREQNTGNIYFFMFKLMVIPYLFKGRDLFFILYPFLIIFNVERTLHAVF